MYSGLTYIMLNDLKLVEISLLKKEMMLQELIEQNPRNTIELSEQDHHFILQEIDYLVKQQLDYQKQNPYLFSMQEELKNVMDLFDFQKFQQAKKNKA